MLNREEIIELVEKDGLVQGYIDLDTQVTPNGFDLTVGHVFEFGCQGAIDFSNKERVVPPSVEVFPQKIKPEDAFGWWELKKGAYKILTNENVTLPKDLIALAFSRTSLLRAGAFTQHGVWDAGFKGESEFMLVVENPCGIRLKQNARIAQLIFLRMKETVRGYQGIYQNHA